VQGIIPIRVITDIRILLQDRGQGLQHAIKDAKMYVDTLISIRQDASTRQAAMDRLDADIVKRGGQAVQDSIDDANKAQDPNKLSETKMAKQGLAANSGDDN
jgi:hypothetical protein